MNGAPFRVVVHPGLGYVFDREADVKSAAGRFVAVVDADDGGTTARYVADCLAARDGDADAIGRVAGVLRDANVRAAHEFAAPAGGV